MTIAPARGNMGMVLGKDSKEGKKGERVIYGEPPISVKQLLPPNNIYDLHYRQRRQLMQSSFPASPDPQVVVEDSMQ